MEGLNWQTIQLPLAAGVNQQTDDRALAPPSLLIAKDVQFDEDGGLQTRHPFAASASSDVFGGGTISNARRLVQNGNEWLLFTDEALYSWNAQLSRWVSRATHLAIAVDERPAFGTTGDQFDGDRAELSGIVVFAWVDAAGLWVAASDKTTGSVLMSPTLANNVGSRPRLVALTTKILLFWVDTAANDIEVIAIDPAIPATAVAGAATTVFAASNSYFDVVKVPNADTAIGANRRSVTTSYEVWKVTAALALSTSTKARTCDGPIAVSCEPTGASVQIIRGNTTNVQGDFLTISTLADVTVGQAIGTVTAVPISQITAAHRSTQDSSAYRCYAFWTFQEATSSADWQARYSFVDTAGTIGTAATLVRRLGLASRAFEYDGRVYVWGVFAGESSFAGAASSSFRAQLQNTYFLYRDDATFHAKSVFQRAGGLAPSVGRLPNVALTSGTTVYSWCATERRAIQIGAAGEQTGADMRAPRDVTFEFDTNRARRCARLGNTLYVTNAEGLLQYDGVGLYEVGVHAYPWYFAAIEVASGNVADGTYAIKNTLRWENAQNEVDRSTTATHGDVTIAGGPNGISIVAWVPLYITHKTNRPIAVEVWRTAVNPSADAPFYLATSKDPAVTSNPNRYIANDTASSLLATFNDEFSDATLTTKETNPENGPILESLAPPPATIIAAYGSRVFLGGVAGEPRRIWYSKQRNEGEVVAFHDSLTFELPIEGGDLVALGFLDGTLVAFCETSTFIVPGDGFDNLGQGANYGPARAVSYDVGCRDHDSVATTPMGLVFQSNKGKYLLNRGFSLTYIGGPVSDHDSETVLACHVDEKRHHVRWLTASRMLVWDYKARSQDNQGQWAEWTVTDGVHAAVLGGTYHYLTSTGSKALGTAYASLTYGMDVETAWVKPSDLQGAARVRWMMLLGEYRSAHHVRIRIFYDYSPTATDDKYWTVSPTTVGGPEQVRIYPSRQRFQAVKIRITAVSASDHAQSPTGEALKLTGLGFEVGLKRGLHRRLPVAQKV